MVVEVESLGFVSAAQVNCSVRFIRLWNLVWISVLEINLFLVGISQVIILENLHRKPYEILEKKRAED